MPINIGTSGVGAVYAGDQVVTSVYVGENLVWPEETFSGTIDPTECVATRFEGNMCVGPEILMDNRFQNQFTGNDFFRLWPPMQNTYSYLNDTFTDLTGTGSQQFQTLFSGDPHAVAIYDNTGSLLGSIANPQRDDGNPQTIEGADMTISFPSGADFNPETMPYLTNTGAARAVIAEFRDADDNVLRQPLMFGTTANSTPSTRLTVNVTFAGFEASYRASDHAGGEGGGLNTNVNIPFSSGNTIAFPRTPNGHCSVASLVLFYSGSSTSGTSYQTSSVTIDGTPPAGIERVDFVSINSANVSDHIHISGIPSQLGANPSVNITITSVAA